MFWFFLNVAMFFLNYVFFFYSYTKLNAQLYACDSDISAIVPTSLLQVSAFVFSKFLEFWMKPFIELTDRLFAL